MPGTFTNLLFHVVFSTKSRAPLIDYAWSDELYRYLGGIMRSDELLRRHGIEFEERFLCD